MNTEHVKVLPVAERDRGPSNLGGVLKRTYLDELNITISEFVSAIGVSCKAIFAIVNKRKSITPEMAMRLAAALGTTPRLWLNLQNNYDLWQTAHRDKSFLDGIKRIAAMF